MYIGLVIAAAAALTKAYQDEQVSKRQSNEIMAGLQQQQADEAKAKAKLAQNLTNFEAQKGADTQAAEQGDYLKTLQQAMGQNGPYQASSALPQTVQLANERARTTGAKDDALAKLYGTIGAAGVQRQNEGFGTQRTGSDLNLLAGSANRQWNAKQLAAQSIHANPWLSMALNFAEAYGMNKAGSAAGAKGGAAADGYLSPNMPYYGAGSTAGYGNFGNINTSRFYG